MKITYLSISAILISFNISAQTLPPNTILSNGQSISSANNKYKLIMQTDGNLVFYRNDGKVRFATYKYGSGNFAAMQGDGNFVQYKSNNQYVWASNTGANPGARLVAQDDGNLVVYSSTNKPLWNIGADSNSNNSGANPQLISDVVGRDLLVPGMSWAGHIGIWDGANVIEAMANQPTSAIRLSTITSFKNEATQNNYTYWGVASPQIPSWDVIGCFAADCSNLNYKPDGQREIVSLRIAIAKRAYRSYLIGADYTLAAAYTEAYPSTYYAPAKRGVYRCDTFVIDSYKVVTYNSPADWEARLLILSTGPILPSIIFERLKNL